MLLACEAPLGGGVDADAGVPDTVWVADPDGVAAAVTEDPGACVEDDAAPEAVVAVGAGLTLEDDGASLIPQTASVSKAVGMGLFQATQLGASLPIASIERH